MNFERMPYPLPLMEKEAIWGPLLQGAKFVGRGLMRSLPMKYMGARVNDSAVMRAAAPLGQKAEQWLNRGISRVAPQHSELAGRLTRGVSKPLMREAFAGAMTGGVLSGGLGAAFAPEGERMNAFTSGFGSGALYGGIGGVLQGGGQGLVKNLRAEGIRNLSAKHNVPMSQVGSGIHKMKFKDALKDSFVGKDPLQKSMARQKVLGSTGAATATFVLPNLINPSSEPEPAPAPPPAPRQPPLVPNRPGVYYPKETTASVRPILKHVDFSRLPG